ncbi:hypothetical protein H2200_008676 [Cladophialophora chaetospira]|uniref:NAD-dependent 15-hydroxyprostaglandin dehydrogenase n=1 Tax=Cladophialophora chaetospira TaxID=386627 RepID=A0AA39CFJ0_9EURO|nr:hypothetical protein H2200_008676 [Cladophialophora chaetospira]
MASASVSGKAALVTGAGSGINLAFTRLLLSRGCNVVLADLNLRPEAEELVQSYTSGSENPGVGRKAQAMFYRTDVSSWTDLSKVFSATKKPYGGVDIVCAGAGVFEPSWSSFWKPPGTGESIVDSVAGGRFKSIDINLTHPIRLTQIAIMDHLRERKAKKTDATPTVRTKTIIHVSSVNGQATPLWSPLYNVSKHGINGFVRTLAPLEKNLGVRVAAIAPGLVKTPLWSETEEKTGPLSKNVVWVTAEEVAEVMLSIVEKNAINSRFRDVNAPSDSVVVPIAGGSILEISGDRVRAVEAFHDPGPQGISREDFDVSQMEEGVFKDLDEHV